jgi:hypothetical protein
MLLLAFGLRRERREREQTAPTHQRERAGARARQALEKLAPMQSVVGAAAGWIWQMAERISH